MAAKTISTQTLSDATGASLRQIHTWATKGYIVEAGEPATQGHPRQWAPSTIKRVSHILRLIDIGFPVKKASELAGKAKFQGANTYVVDTLSYRLEWIQS